MTVEHAAGPGRTTAHVGCFIPRLLPEQADAATLA
jgi:hypothetical protein